MDFTREPIIETVITPKESCTLVVRSSKSSGQEEYFVDAVEVVCFGNSFFFRSRERPKSFLVPVGDYEVVEVRETRLVLKNVAFDRSIKIGGGREATMRSGGREPPTEKSAPISEGESKGREKGGATSTAAGEEKDEARLDKKRERRRGYRRKRQDHHSKEGEENESRAPDEESSPLPMEALEEESGQAPRIVTSVVSSLLPPPNNLISETIGRYKDNALFKGAFFIKGESDQEDQSSTELEVPTFSDVEEPIMEPTISLDQPHYAVSEMGVEPNEQPFSQEEVRGNDEISTDEKDPKCSDADPLFFSDMELPPQKIRESDDLSN